MLNVFIGFDSRETVAFHVLAHSILERATRPVSITALVQRQLRHAGSYGRERGATESTEFSLTRFLVPYLAGYKGQAIFMDCDMLCRADLTQLTDEIAVRESHEGRKAVWVCQHDYTPKDSTKFLGQQQTAYPRKNWSSFMLFNCDLCETLTPDYVHHATGLELHRFHWLPDDQIGSLPLEWNWLIGEYPMNPDAKVLHYTLGGPWFSEYQTCDHSPEWFAEKERMIG